MKNGKWLELYLIMFFITIVAEKVLKAKGIIQDDDNQIFNTICVCYLIIFIVLSVIYLYIKNKPNNQ